MTALFIVVGFVLLGILVVCVLGVFANGQSRDAADSEYRRQLRAERERRSA